MNSFNRVICKILNSVLGMILCVVSAFVFYIPYEIEILPQAAPILYYARPVCGLLLIIFFFLLYISAGDFFHNNLVLFSAMLFVAYLIYITWKNGGVMQDALGKNGLYAIANLLIFAIFLKVNPKKYLLVLFIFYGLITAANVYTVYAYYGYGMWEEFGKYRNEFFSLVGNYNVGIRYVMPMIICGAAYSYLYGWWLEIFNYLLMAANLVMAFKIDSSAQKVAFALVIVVLIAGDIIRAFPKSYNYFFRVFNAGVLMAVNFALAVGVVFLMNREWVARFGIDTGFHNRLYIWDGAKEWILRNPIWGYGLEDVNTFVSKFTGNPAHCHCLYLEIPYCTGLIGSGIFLIMIVVTVVAVMRAKRTGIRFLMGCMIFIVFFASLVESYTFVYAIMMLGLPYYIARFAKGPGMDELYFK